LLDVFCKNCVFLLDEKKHHTKDIQRRRGRDFYWREKKALINCLYCHLGILI
jgi:hypothetical protein